MSEQGQRQYWGRSWAATCMAVAETREGRMQVLVLRPEKSVPVARTPNSRVRWAADRPTEEQTRERGEPRLWRLETCMTADGTTVDKDSRG